MDERKNEELAQLYALRAGLSAIAEQQKEVLRLQPVIEEEKQIFRLKEEKLLSERQKIVTDIQKNQDECDKAKYRAGHPSGNIASTVRQYVAGQEEIARLLQRKIDILKEQLNEIDARIDEHLKTFSSENTVLLQSIFQTALTLSDALQTEYSDLLDTRDWGELDLVIYAYETKRADTIKEALAFVDNERRTTRIANTISEATARLGENIQAGLRGVAVNMVKCFRAISDQMLNMSQIMVLGAEMQQNQSAALMQQNQAMLARIDYANALQAQRNVSSQKLVEGNRVFLSQAKHSMDQLTIALRNNGGNV